MVIELIVLGIILLIFRFLTSLIIEDHFFLFKKRGSLVELSLLAFIPQSGQIMEQRKS